MLRLGRLSRCLGLELISHYDGIHSVLPESEVQFLRAPPAAAYLSGRVKMAKVAGYDWPQLEKWALEVLQKANGDWVLPDSYSMRQALDHLWVANQAIEKWWRDGRNIYRLKPFKPAPI